MNYQLLILVLIMEIIFGTYFARRKSVGLIIGQSEKVMLLVTTRSSKPINHKAHDLRVRRFFIQTHPKIYYNTSIRNLNNKQTWEYTF